MDRFYLENVAKYRSLVDAHDRTPKLRVSTGQASPNIVVGARIRPLAKDEGFPSAIFPRPHQHNVVDIHDLYNHPRGTPILKSFDYEVDRLFDTHSTTKKLYEDLVADLVPFAWNGGIATLFAYGQTGSGKTFTVSRVEELVADTLMDGRLTGEREIYLTIIDLAGNAAFDLLNKRAFVSLLEDSFGVTQMVGVDERRVSNREEMKSLIDCATSFRRTAPTLKNDASSRSHAICRIRIKDLDTDLDGLLYLIDLAGSEGARDVAVHGADRMRETKEINMSLSVLKDCIRGKAQADSAASSGKQKSGSKVPHIPFRQSALTKVLKHVFDPASVRPCKTVVIACVNPSLADVGPSKNTLRFAEMLRVFVPTKTTASSNTASPLSWTNAQLREWIKENSGTPPIRPDILAPRETGIQLLTLSSTEFEYRCRKSASVTPELAKAFRSKLWQLHIDTQHARKPQETSISKTASSIEPDNTLRLTTAISSRQLDPLLSKLSFKERLRPGMVVNYVLPLGHRVSPDLPDGPRMAILLCPVEVKQEASRKTHEGRPEPAETFLSGVGGTEVSEKRQYTCALLTPGQMADAYELNIWMQIVIDVEWMNAEVHMEYDTATRYYYLSV